MTLSYDKKADVLYITFESVTPGSCVYVENEHGDVLRLDRRSRRVVGCTILSFAARTKQGKITIPQVGEIPFNEVAARLIVA